MCEGEGLANSGGVAGDDSEGGHGEGKEIEDDRAEEVVDEEHTVLHKLGLGVVVAIGQEFVVGGDEEGERGSGLLANAVEGKLDEDINQMEKTTTTIAKVL
ncbi:helix-turn-helix domain-containing protein [Sesbania bispinosa]|nr:helix-turn-helix domain-containing protein [Sesbania bispinosa]